MWHFISLLGKTLIVRYLGHLRIQTKQKIICMMAGYLRIVFIENLHCICICSQLLIFILDQYKLANWGLTFRQRSSRFTVSFKRPVKLAIEYWTPGSFYLTIAASGRHVGICPVKTGKLY